MSLGQNQQWECEQLMKKLQPTIIPWEVQLLTIEFNITNDATEFDAICDAILMWIIIHW